MASTTPTAAELENLSLACDRLWHLDKNRLRPGIDYELNLQNGKNCWQHGDVAADPLFTFVDECVFERPTFHLFTKLLDNYERGVGIRETVTAEELGENHAFLTAVVDSAPMRYAYNWLTKNKKFVGDMSSFKKKLDTIWFGLYRRQTHNDSSGFEHVFLGEEKDGKICGCHNWIQIYCEERAGRLNYLGYVRPKQRGHSITTPQNHEQLVTIQFMWEKEIKPVSTSLIGVSPEFEMALYTMCFLNGKEDNIVQLGPYHCNIKCYPFGHGQNVKVGSAFPDAAPMTVEQAAVKIQAAARGRITRQQSSGQYRGQRVVHHQHYEHHHHHHHDGGEENVTKTVNAWAQPPHISGASSVTVVTMTTTKVSYSSTSESGVPAPAPPPTAQGAWATPHKW